MTLAETCFLLTTEARQRYAEALFDIDRISEALQERARHGYRDYRLTQEHPFDLVNTPLANRVEDWLEKQCFRYAWYPTLPLPEPNRTTSSSEYHELVVFW